MCEITLFKYPFRGRPEMASSLAYKMSLTPPPSIIFRQLLDDIFCYWCIILNSLMISILHFNWRISPFLIGEFSIFLLHLGVLQLVDERTHYATFPLSILVKVSFFRHSTGHVTVSEKERRFCCYSNMPEGFAWDQLEGPVGQGHLPLNKALFILAYYFLIHTNWSHCLLLA